MGIFIAAFDVQKSLYEPISVSAGILHEEESDALSVCLVISAEAIINI